jgi:CelD/BcsL family acetyltransferase involved in cellulose biosynthesis
MAKIKVDICSPSPAVAEAWDELVRHASANAFMHPGALRAAAETKFAKVHVLLARDESAEPNKLLGLWALRETNVTPLGPGFLAGPPYDYAFVSNPVVDAARADEVIPAFFEAIANNSALPNVIRLRYLDADTESYPAIVQALSARGSQILKLSERPRPFASREVGLKRSGSTRKKLRQDWNRLCGLGAVEIVNERAQNAVLDAFDEFLAMEAESWKGANGTALLSREADATFAQQLIGNMAAQEDASVALLHVEGQPIAAQVLFYCGTMAYTWKTAFRSAYAKYSPGALLVDRITEQLFSAGRIEAIESCSPEGGFMTQLWDGRRTSVDLLADVGPRISLNFTMAAIGERGYLQLRALRNKLRSVSLLPQSKRKAAAASR